MTGPGLNLLIDTCEIRSFTTAANSVTGEPVPTWSDAAASRCAIQAMKSHEELAWRRETGVTVLWVFLPVSASIKTQYRIVPSTGTYSGKILSVIGPPQDKAGRRSHLSVPCEIVEGGGGS